MQQYLEKLELIINQQLAILLIVAQALSLLGAVFIIFSYLKFKSIRTIAFQLVYLLTYSDLLISIVYIFGTQILDKNDEQTKNVVSQKTSNNIIAIIESQGNLKQLAPSDHIQKTSGVIDFCVLQSFLLNAGYLSSFLWTSVIAFSIRVSLKNNLAILVSYYFPKFLIFVYGFSITWSLMYNYFYIDFLLILGLLISSPLVSNDYGALKHYCWIKLDDEHILKGTFMRLIQFYIPLWSVFIFNCLSYYQTAVYLDSLPSHSRETQQLIKRLKYYPMVLFICYVWASINRFLELFGLRIQIFYCLHVIFSSLQGFLNAFIYGFTKSVQRRWWEYLKEKYPSCFKSNSSQKRESQNFQNQEILQESKNIQQQQYQVQSEQIGKMSLTSNINLDQSFCESFKSSEYTPAKFTNKWIIDDEFDNQDEYDSHQNMYFYENKDIYYHECELADLTLKKNDKYY